MATLPVPRTWTVGELLTAAKMNTDVRNGLNFLLAKPLAVLRRAGAQAAASGLDTILSWDTEDIDRDAGHDNGTNPTRYTAQTAGWYAFRARADWGSGLTTGTYVITLRKNGSFQVQEAILPTGAGGSTVNEVSGTFFFSVGDYEEVYMTQNSGSGKNVGGGTNTRLEVEWISAA